MNVLIVYANPNPKSFSHAILDTLDQALREKGHDTRINDLYQSGYKVIMDQEDMSMIYGEKKIPDDIIQEQQKVAWAQGLALIYPVWWFGPPAIVKGWIDRTFQNGGHKDCSSIDARG